MAEVTTSSDADKALAIARSANSAHGKLTTKDFDEISIFAAKRQPICV
jgi:hypothetical protein